MNEHDVLTEKLKQEADEALFKDVRFDDDLRQRVLTAVRPDKRVWTNSRSRWFVVGTLVASMAGVLLFKGLPVQPKPAPITPQAAPSPSSVERGLKQALPIPQVGEDRSAKINNSLVMSDLNRLYPAADAVPATITYKLETALPQTPGTVRSFQVNRAKVTLAEAQRLAQQFGFSQAQMKRFNDSFWTIGRDPQGQTITEGWPDNKGEPGTWLQVWDSRHLYWWSKPTAPAPASTPTVAWLEDAARRWLQDHGLTSGAALEWRGELNPNSLAPGHLPMLLWRASIDGFPISGSEAQFEVAADGAVAYASFPLWQIGTGSAVATKTPDEALAELQRRTIRLDRRTEHTVTIDKAELVYADPSASGQGDLDLFYCFSGRDDNGEPFNQYIYARQDKIGLAPWERP